MIDDHLLGVAVLIVFAVAFTVGLIAGVLAVWLG